MSDFLDGKQWKAIHGDCIEVMATLPPESCDLSIFSPPFPSLFSFSSSERDIGNSDDLASVTWAHLSYFYRQLRRVMKPGCVVVVHCAQIPRMKRAGGRGLADFRGMNIRLAERAGLIYEYDWLVRKNPQAQAIRNRVREMQFVGLERDRRKCRGALGDYLIKFFVPGDAPPVHFDGEVSRNDWIAWAEGGWWNDINEQDTLNLNEARGPDDTKHLTPLQLEVYRRIISMFTNPGEIVLEPFGGFGSGAYVALGGVSPKTKKRLFHQRRVVSIELKDEYYRAKLVNIQRAERQFAQLSGGRGGVGASRSGSILDACEEAGVN